MNSKTRFFVAFTFFLIHISQAQNTISLDQCLQSFKSHQPLFKLKELNLTQLDLANGILNTNYLPGLGLEAQASYQSEVTSLPIKIPNVPIDELSKDQYKMSLNLQQLLYDGGQIKNQKKFNTAKSTIDNQQIEIQLYNQLQQIIKLFYSVLLIQKQDKISNLFLSQLDKRIKQAESGLAQGVIIASDLRLLQIKKLSLEQEIAEHEKDKKTAIDILNLYCGLGISSTDNFTSTITATINNARPELSLYDLQRSLTRIQQKQLRAKNSPRLLAYGTGAYGRPGLNFLKDEFDFYGLAGLKLNWNLSPLYSGQFKKEKNLLKLSSLQADIQEDQFKLQNSVQVLQQRESIDKIETSISFLEKQIKLLQQNKIVAENQLDQGIITSTEYLDKLTDELVATQKLETLSVQKKMMETEQLWIQGNLIK